MSHLDPLARAILLALTVTSDVASKQGWMREDAPRAAASSEPNYLPPGVVLGPHRPEPGSPEHFASRYAGCRDDEQRRAVLVDALEELRSLRHGRKPKIDIETYEGRLQVGRDRRETWIVAYEYGYSEQHVRRLRKAAEIADRAGRMR